MLLMVVCPVSDKRIFNECWARHRYIYRAEFIKDAFLTGVDFARNGAIMEMLYYWTSVHRKVIISY
jgi:hypothetical protein